MLSENMITSPLKLELVSETNEIAGKPPSAKEMTSNTIEKYVCLYRVSTQMQGQEGYGLKAQMDCCRKFCIGSIIIQEFDEIVSGRCKRRPLFNQATRACRKFKATLLVSRFDRVSRRRHFLSELSSMGIKLKIATHPEADETVLTLYSLMAENEAKLISERTRRALAVRKERQARSGIVPPKKRISYCMMKYATLKQLIYMMKDTKTYREVAQYHSDRGKTHAEIAEQIMEDMPTSKHIRAGQVKSWLAQNKKYDINTLESEAAALYPFVIKYQNPNFMKGRKHMLDKI
jgi:DNA invertase Pin-like site-specific DNA recombinase